MCVLSASRVRLWDHFGCTFVDFSGFVILLKLGSRVGGSTFLRVWVGPTRVFFTPGACEKKTLRKMSVNAPPPLACEFYGPAAASHH